MKKLFSTLCIASAALGIAACDTTGEGFRESSPYESKRTAGTMPGHSTSGETQKTESATQSGEETREVESAEPVFDKKMRK